MPIYAFLCNQCGHQFDRLQRLSDTDPEICPACAAHAVQRKLSAPHFRLAGSGWYETDFKKAGEKKHNLADSGDSAAEAGSSASSAGEDNSSANKAPVPDPTPAAS